VTTHPETTRPREGSFPAAGPVPTTLLLSLFAVQAAAFAAAAVSGRIPSVVLNLFRALLTL